MSEERSASEYIEEFDSCIKLTKAGAELKEVYDWCEQYMGKKYRDWFMYNTTDPMSGYRKFQPPKYSIIYIKSGKHATMFRLRWMEIIEESIDISKE